MENYGWTYPFGLLMLLLVYLVIHMLYNRITGKDELDGLFRLRIKRRNKKK
jgi:hypothetical protein